MNMYTYCHNNPSNRVDPYGHDPCDPDPPLPPVDPNDPNVGRPPDCSESDEDIGTQVKQCKTRVRIKAEKGRDMVEKACSMLSLIVRGRLGDSVYKRCIKNYNEVFVIAFERNATRYCERMGGK